MRFLNFFSPITALIIGTLFYYPLVEHFQNANKAVLGVFLIMGISNCIIIELFEYITGKIKEYERNRLIKK